MEDFLLSKISAISEEEENILSGAEIDRGLYTNHRDFIVSSDKITGGTRDITVRTHTRYTEFPTHRHNYLEMMIVLGGTITHRIADEVITLSDGDILILNKHVSHSIDKAGAPDIGVNIILSDSFVDSLAKELYETVFSELAAENLKSDGRGIYLCFSTKGNKQVTNIIENLIFELTEYSLDIQILRYTTALLFDYLSKKSEKLLRVASRLPDREQARKSVVMSYIRSSYRNATLGELAENMFLSMPYLSKLIREYFGKSFKELLIEERMARAERLILDTNISIGDVINSVGYENESYFHREFKKITGSSPLALRKRAKTEEKK